MRLNMKQLAITLTLAFFAAVQSGCAGPAKSMATTQPQTAIEPSATTEASVNTDQQTDTESLRLAGKVVETMDAGGYTYICLEKSGKRIWVAAPKMQVSVGQDIEFLPGMKMANFTSKALNRTFQIIIFSDGPVAKKTGSVMPASGDLKYKA